MVNSINVRVEGSNTFYRGLPADVIEALKMRFRIPEQLGIYHNCLLTGNQTEVMTPTGLMPRVINYLKTISTPYDVQKNIREVEIGSGFLKPDYLRHNQKELIEKCLEKKRGIAKAPTGFGKTACIAELLYRFSREEYKIVFVPTTTLLHQTRKDLEQYLGRPVGIAGDGKVDIRDITVAIPDTIYSRLEELADYLPLVVAVIYDECHFYLNPTSFAISDRMVNTKYRWGLSATPNLGIISEGLMGPLIIEFTEMEQMEQGVILTPTIYFHEVQDAVELPWNLKNFRFDTFSTWQEKSNYKKLYDLCISTNKGRNSLIASIVAQRLEEGRTVLVLVNSVGTTGKVSHANILQALLRERGIHLDILHGETPPRDRKDYLDGLANRTIRGLIASTGTIGVGVDISTISSIINAGGGRESVFNKQANSLVQKIGRALRIGDKLSPIVDDFMDIDYPFKGQSMSRLKKAQETYGKQNVEVISAAQSHNGGSRSR